MERIYRCTSCGLRSRVVADASDVASIHCPRCGSEAVFRPGWSDAPGGPVVQLDFSSPGRDDTLSAEVPFDPDGDTVRQDGPTRPVGHANGRAPHARHVEEVDDPHAHHRPTKPVSFESERRSRPRAGGTATPVAPPSRALSSTPQPPMRPLSDPVTAIPEVEIADTAEMERPEPRYPVLSSPVPGDEEEVERTTRKYAALDMGEGSNRAPPGLAAARERRELADAGVPWPGAEPAETDPAHPVQAIWSGSAPAQYGPQAQPAENIARGGRGLEGRAWSASGIQRALRAQGLGDEAELQSPRATPTRGMSALPQKPRMHIGVPESDSAGGEPFPQSPTAPAPVPVSSSAPAPAPSPGEAARPPGRRPAPSQAQQRATPVPRRRQSGPPPSSRILILLTVCAGVLSIGVVVGVLWYEGQSGHGGSDGLERMDASAETLALAERRTNEYALEPLVLDGPVEVAWRAPVVEYPNRLELTLQLTNRGTRAIAALHVSAAWYVVHDVPGMTQTTSRRFDRPVTVAEPLEPGESVRAQLALALEDPPPGSPRESFVWVSVTAADDHLEIIFDGGVAMIGVEPPAP